MRIIKEDPRGCINWIAAGMPEATYLVVRDNPWVCRSFKTERDARDFIASKEREERHESA